MVRRMCQGSSKRTMNRPGFSADDYFEKQVLVGQASELVLEHAPALDPQVLEILAAIVERLELRIAVSPRLFAVAGQEIGKARYEVSADVLDENGDGIPFGAYNLVKSGIGNRSRCLEAHGLVAGVFSGKVLNDVF